MAKQLVLGTTSPTLGTGVRLVDELFGGGLRPGEALLVAGPPFCGKRALLDRAAGAAPDGTNVVAVCAAGPPGARTADRARIVDAYSRAAGGRSTFGAVAVAADAIEDVVASVDDALAAQPDRARLVTVDSLSVLAAPVSRDRFFASFRRLVGVVRNHDAAALFALEPDAHPSADLPVLARLADGMLRLAPEHDGHVLSFQRPDRPPSPWTEYTFGADQFDVTGSFHAKRIR